MFLSISASMDRSGFEKLAHRLSSRSTPRESLLVGMESAACYHLNLYSYLISWEYIQRRENACKDLQRNYRLRPEQLGHNQSMWQAMLRENVPQFATITAELSTDESRQIISTIDAA
jgi:hypothetical protein